jgi:pimeloyl-ACP methyl ester carboxylesterase
VIDRLEIDANRLTFSARAAGPTKGRGVILLHGFPQTSWSWRAVLTMLAAAGYRAFAPDQRGYSVRARPTAVDDYAMDYLVSDVLALANAMQWETFDLVGHDWGGMVAWVAAARHPERIRSLSVLSTPHPVALRRALLGADPEQAARAADTHAFRQRDEAERLLLGTDGSGSGLYALFTASGLAPTHTQEYLAVLTQPGALTAAVNWYRATDSDCLADLPLLKVPTLYDWSTGDAALGRSAAEASREFVAAPYRFVVLDGVPHWIPELAPRKLAQLLISHLVTT